MSKVECSACHGTGRRPLPSGELRSCRACDGTGDYRYAPAVTSIETKIRVADKAAPPVGGSRTGGLVKGLDVKRYDIEAFVDVRGRDSWGTVPAEDGSFCYHSDVALAVTSLRAELAETRVRLARARAAWWFQRELHYDPYASHPKSQRAARLCRHFRERFEREAEETKP